MRADAPAIRRGGGLAVAIKAVRHCELSGAADDRVPEFVALAARGDVGLIDTNVGSLNCGDSVGISEGGEVRH